MFAQNLYLHVYLYQDIPTHPFIYMDFTEFLVCGKFRFCFLELYAFFSPNIFKPQFVESFGNKPADKEDQLYKGFCYFILSPTPDIVSFLLYLFQ